jgi:hypothetical protein
MHLLLPSAQVQPQRNRTLWCDSFGLFRLSDSCVTSTVCVCVCAKNVQARLRAMQKKSPVAAQNNERRDKAMAVRTDQTQSYYARIQTHLLFSVSCR